MARRALKYDGTKIYDEDLKHIIRKRTAEYKIFRVRYVGNPTVSWMLKEGKVGVPGESYEGNKNKAVEKAREYASRESPSVLIIERMDRSVQDWTRYR